MAEEIDVENGRNSNFEGLVTLTLTFDPAVPHTVVHQSSTCTYIPNFMEMGRKKISKVNTDFHSNSFKLKKLFVDGRTYGRTDGRTGGRTFSPLYY